MQPELRDRRPRTFVLPQPEGSAMVVRLASTPHLEPAKPHETTVNVNTHLDGRVVAKNTMKHIVRQGNFSDYRRSYA
jgi:hypothetical protein